MSLSGLNEEDLLYTFDLVFSFSNWEKPLINKEFLYILILLFVKRLL